jgi:hypothetical protein
VLFRFTDSKTVEEVWSYYLCLYDFFKKIVLIKTEFGFVCIQRYGMEVFIFKSLKMSLRKAALHSAERSSSPTGLKINDDLKIFASSSISNRANTPRNELVTARPVSRLLCPDPQDFDLSVDIGKSVTGHYRHNYTPPNVVNKWKKTKKNNSPRIKHGSYRDLRLKPSRMFRLMSDLNGNNGEWTNSDDLDQPIFTFMTPADINDTNKRNHKQAHNLLNSHPVNISYKQKCGQCSYDKKLTADQLKEHIKICSGYNGPNVQKAVCGLCKYLTPMTIEELSRHRLVCTQLKTPVFKQKCGQCNYSKKMTEDELKGHRLHCDEKKNNVIAAYNRVNRIPVVKPNEFQSELNDEPCEPQRKVHKVRYHIGSLSDEYFVFGQTVSLTPFYEVKPPGNYPVSRFGFGWCEIDNESQEQRVVGVNVTLVVEQHHNSGVFVPTKTYTIDGNVHQDILTTLRPTQFTLSTLNVVVSKANSFYQPPGLVPMRKVLTYFTACLYFRNRDTEGHMIGQDVTNRNYYEVLKEYDLVHYESINLGSPWTRTSQECKLHEKWELRTDVKVIHKRGDISTEVLDQPHFEHTTSIPRWYTTHMCSFEGLSKFVMYDNIPQNTQQAMKRFLAQRKNEDELVANQWVIGALFIHQIKTYQGNIFCDPLVERGARVCGYSSTTHLVDTHNYYFNDTKGKIATALARYVHSMSDNDTLLYRVFTAVPRSVPWLFLGLYQSLQYVGEPLLSRSYAANIIHVKRRLRRQMVENQTLHDTKDIMVNKIKGQVKCEWAKPGKNPRLFAAYGEGAMYANELPEFVKLMLYAPYILEEKGETFYFYVFVKRSLSDLDELFNIHFQDVTPGHHYCYCYSDDSIWFGVTKEGRKYAYNKDIKSCDMSNRNAVFLILFFMLSKFDPARSIGLMLQCLQPMVVRNPIDPSEVFEILFNNPNEGSGTVLTFLLNCIAKLMIWLDHIYSTNDFDAADVTLASYSGHEVTVSDDFSNIPEKLQFLKMSPMKSLHDGYVWVRNYGCTLRGFGSILGDLDHIKLAITKAQFDKMSWADRMDLYLSGVVNSYKHEPSTRLMVALRKRFNLPISADFARQIESTTHYPMLEIGLDRQDIIAQESSVCSRYDITEENIMKLCTSISDLKIGDVVVDDSLTMIYHTDYDMPLVSA